MEFITLSDLVFTPIVLIFIYFIARFYSKRKIVDHPEFKYFLPGLGVKLIGGIGVCLVYTVYYPGGDTLQYFNDAMCMVRLLFIHPESVYRILFYPHDPSIFWYFNAETGFPAYTRDPQTFFIVKLALPIILLSLQSFFVSTIIIATLSFIGIWRLYRVFIMEFPMLRRELAIAIFFVPSVFFWGSGLLKDTFTFSAIGFFLYSYYMCFIKNNKDFRYIVTLTASVFIILSIKPYIFVGLMPGVVFWQVYRMLSTIKGGMARIAAVPLLTLLGIGFGYLLLNVLSSQLSQYTLENLLSKASVTQRDLKMDYYRGNSFDIGDYDPTISSMAGKAPQAIFAALFRPFILEANNIVMFISSVENLIILIFTIRVLFMVRIFGIFRFFFRHHLLTFSLVFSIFFAFAVGISTSNFGSLVRYKIPCIPFYISSLFIIRYLRSKEIEEWREENTEYSEVEKLIRFESKEKS